MTAIGWIVTVAVLVGVAVVIVVLARRHGPADLSDPEGADRRRQVVERPAGPDAESMAPEARDERAEHLARDVAEDNPDPTTRREAIEQALEAEGLSEEGEELGQHNE